jgi:hypothetical protein
MRADDHEVVQRLCHVSDRLAAMLGCHSRSWHASSFRRCEGPPDLHRAQSSTHGNDSSSAQTWLAGVGFGCDAREQLGDQVGLAPLRAMPGRQDRPSITRSSACPSSTMTRSFTTFLIRAAILSDDEQLASRKLLKQIRG